MSTKPKVSLSAEAVAEIRRVSNYISDEFEPTAELVMDRMQGAPAKEVSELVRQHGYRAVNRAVAVYV